MEAHRSNHRYSLDVSRSNLEHFLLQWLLQCLRESIQLRSSAIEVNGDELVLVVSCHDDQVTNSVRLSSLLKSIMLAVTDDLHKLVQSCTCKHQRLSRVNDNLAHALVSSYTLPLDGQGVS